MTHQRILKEKKKNLNEKLHYFLIFKTTQDNVERFSNRINSQEYIDQLNNIDAAMEYLGEHVRFLKIAIFEFLILFLDEFQRVANLQNEIRKFTSKRAQ